MNILAHVRAALRGEHVLGASPDVGRVFMVCYECRRVVPAWRLVMSEAKPGTPIGCRCGSAHVKTATINALASGWWFFVRGLAWRKLVRRLKEWDPRVPVRKPSAPL